MFIKLVGIILGFILFSLSFEILFLYIVLGFVVAFLVGGIGCIEVTWYDDTGELRLQLLENLELE